MLLCFFPFLTNYCTCLKHMAGNEGNQKAKLRKGNEGKPENKANVSRE